MTASLSFPWPAWELTASPRMDEEYEIIANRRFCPLFRALALVRVR